MSEDSTHKKSIVINTDFFKSSGRGRPRKFSAKSGDDSDGEGSMGGGKIPAPRRNTTQKLRTPATLTASTAPTSSAAGLESPNRMRELLLRRIRQHQRQVQQEHLSQIQSRNDAMLTQSASGVVLSTEHNRVGAGAGAGIRTGGPRLTPSQQSAYNQLKISPTVRSLSQASTTADISSFDDSLSYLNEVARRRKMERDLQQRETTEQERLLKLRRLQLQQQEQSQYQSHQHQHQHQAYTRKYPGGSEPAYGNLKGGMKPTYKTLKARSLYGGEVAPMTSAVAPASTTPPTVASTPTPTPAHISIPTPTPIMDSQFDDAFDSEPSHGSTPAPNPNQIATVPSIPPSSVILPQIPHPTYSVTPSVSLDRQQRLELLRHQRASPHTQEVPQLYRNRTPPMQLHPSGEEITRNTHIELSKTEKPTMEMFVDTTANPTTKSDSVIPTLLTEVQQSDIEGASASPPLTIPTSATPSLDNRFKKYRIKTRRRIYKLGKDDKERKVSILIKNHHTRKTIQNQIMDLNKISMYDIKKFLRERNLLRVGSEAPDDVLRETFRAVKLAGDIQNQNGDVFLHNFFNKEKEEEDD